MPKTRSQKRAASQVEPSLARAVPAKRARQRSTTVVEPPGATRDAVVSKDLAPTRKGKERERPPAGLTAIPAKRVALPNRCHVYLAGPEDYRSGLDERENEQLEAAAEELLIQGKKLAAVEMHDLRGQARDGKMDGPWMGNYWRAMKMRDYETIDYIVDSRTWRYSAPPLPSVLDLSIISCKGSDHKMVSNIVNLPDWRRTTAAESFQLYRPNIASASRPHGDGSHDLLETPIARLSGQNHGPTILLSPLSIRGPAQPGGPSHDAPRPPDLEWLDPDLDDLPDFEWGWDKGLEKHQSDTQRESLTMWRQSLSGSHDLRVGQAKSEQPHEPRPDLSTTGMVSCLTDPSIVEETVTEADPAEGKAGQDPRYQRLPLRLAPFAIPAIQPPAPAVTMPKEPPTKATKSRKKAAKQNLPETIKDVKPMKQELSPFILRSVIQDREGETSKMDDRTDASDGMALAVFAADEQVIDANESRLPDTGVVHEPADGAELRDSPEAMRFQAKPVDNPVASDSTNWMHSHRKWARKLISRDRRFGQCVDMIPEPLSLHVPEDGPAYTQVANQAIGAPIKMPSSPHPFHPDLATLIDTQPKLRVRWVIPIHGPTILLTPHDIQHKFWPSPAIIRTKQSRKNFDELDDMITTENRQRNRRDVLIWTPDAMTKFWKETAKLQARGTCGPISVGLSGPHPDPFRPVSSAWSLAAHRRTTRLDPGSPLQSPIRPFAGDHLRIGCDLEHALIFRMWLGTRSFGFPAITTDGNKQRSAENPFLRIKLCLCGPMGEVLAVI